MDTTLRNLGLSLFFIEAIVFIAFAAYKVVVFTQVPAEMVLGVILAVLWNALAIILIYMSRD